MGIREILRQLRAGQTNRAVARATGINRKTAGRYRAWVARHGLLSRLLPPLGESHQLVEGTLKSPSPPQNISSVEPYREQVDKLHEEGVEIAAICERLNGRGYNGSYSSVHRLVRNLEPKSPDVMVYASLTLTALLLACVRCLSV